jgi:hypothetical protein
LEFERAEPLIYFRTDASYDLIVLTRKPKLRHFSKSDFIWNSNSRLLCMRDFVHSTILPFGLLSTIMSRPPTCLALYFPDDNSIVSNDSPSILPIIAIPFPINSISEYMFLERDINWQSPTFPCTLVVPAPILILRYVWPFAFELISPSVRFLLRGS